MLFIKQQPFKKLGFLETRRRCQSPPPTVSKPRLFDHVRMRSAHAPARASATTAHATAATGEMKGAPGWG